MARIQFDYGWHDDAKQIIRYTALPTWTWKDYHSVTRASAYAIQSVGGAVDVLLDLSATEGKFPTGVAAHGRTFGKKIAPNQTGRAVVVGLPEDVLSKLGVLESRRMQAADGEVRFVDSVDEAEVVLAGWK